MENWVISKEDRGRVERTFAMAMQAEKIIGAIQWTLESGPRLVQANPNRPIVKSGATETVSVDQHIPGSTNRTATSTDGLLAAKHPDPAP